MSFEVWAGQSECSDQSVGGHTSRKLAGESSAIWIWGKVQEANMISIPEAGEKTFISSKLSLNSGHSENTHETLNLASKLRILDAAMNLRCYMWLD